MIQIIVKGGETMIGNEEVGKRLDELRESKSLTVNKLATETGISQSFVREVILGNKSISVLNLSVLCDTLHITMTEFFSGIENTNTTTEDKLASALKRLNDEQKNKLADLLNSF